MKASRTSELAESQKTPPDSNPQLSLPRKFSFQPWYLHCSSLLEPPPLCAVCDVCSNHKYHSLTIWKNCGEIASGKFSSDENDPKGETFYCETHFIRRLDLICRIRGGPLRDSHVTTVEKNHHLEHFGCKICGHTFGAEESYYEYSDRILCHYHYCLEFACLCKGCDTPILKQLLEIFHTDEVQPWHPECFIIHRYWNVRGIKANATFHHDSLGWKDESGLEPTRQDMVAWTKNQESAILQTWQVLSVFEKNTASRLSDMLANPSKCEILQVVQSCSAFVLFVDALFLSLHTVMEISLDEGVKRTDIFLH